jgi:hypothetical protein
VPRVVPSDVVRAVDRMFPDVEKRPTDFPNMTPEWVPSLMALADLVAAIPNELLVLDPGQYAELTASVAFLRGAAQVFQAPRVPTAIPLRLRGFERHPVAMIRAAMAVCPDEAPATRTTALPFIADAALRDSIRLDISAANSNLAQGEWKAATVLAGSTVEALLLWALQERGKSKPGEVGSAVSALIKAKTLKGDPGGNLEGPGWHLHEYVEVAANLSIIQQDSAAQVRLAKDARNLVHPGRAARLGQKCDRFTALAALAAVEAVARDLTSS